MIQIFGDHEFGAWRLLANTPEFSLNGYPPYFKQLADTEQRIDVGAMIQDSIQGLPTSAKGSRELFLAVIAVLNALLDLFHNMLGRAFVGLITHGRYLLRRPSKGLKEDRPTNALCVVIQFIRNDFPEEFNGPGKFFFCWFRMAFARMMEPVSNVDREGFINFRILSMLFPTLGDFTVSELVTALDFVIERLDFDRTKEFAIDG